MIKRIEINRLFHGLATVRDYQADEALEKNMALLIVLKGSGEEMLIPCDDIALRIIKVSKNKFKSRHDDKEYRLVDFEWKPTSRQTKLL